MEELFGIDPAIWCQLTIISWKKERVISRILYSVKSHDHFTGMLIAQHLLQPTRRSRTGRSQTSPYLVLLRMGFTLPPMSPWKRWALTSPFHPYPALRVPGGLFSVALSPGHPAFVLRTILPCGVRTFLSGQSTGAIMRPLLVQV